MNLGALARYDRKERAVVRTKDDQCFYIAWYVGVRGITGKWERFECLRVPVEWHDDPNHRPLIAAELMRIRREHRERQ